MIKPHTYILSGIKLADMSDKKPVQIPIPRKNEMNICLNCKKKKCTGNCKKVKKI